MSKKWYTNGITQTLAENCPDGFHPGRLSVSDETKKKHSINNAWKNMSEEQKINRSNKIATTINNRTKDEKTAYSQKLSDARRGKGLGNIPWNKGKSGLQTAWNKGFHMTDEAKQHLKNVYANLSPEEKERRKKIISDANKNKIPWNKGLHYKLSEETVKQAKEKEIASKKLKNNFSSSVAEDNFYLQLLNYFLPDQIVRQYFDIDRYPFNCDFYITPLDLFIEINLNWTHGFMPYNETDVFCIEQLTQWKQKAEKSDYYKNAIYTWTDLDVRKRKTVEQNNLLFVSLYNETEINEFFKLLEEDT